MRNKKPFGLKRKEKKTEGRMCLYCPRLNAVNAENARGRRGNKAVPLICELKQMYSYSHQNINTSVQTERCACFEVNFPDKTERRDRLLFQPSCIKIPAG